MRFFLLLLLIQPIGIIAQSLGPEDKVMSIFFGGGSYYIDDHQIEDLRNFLDEAAPIEAYQIEVHGHTDDIGRKEYNQYLSEMRSAAAIAQMEKMGIDKRFVEKYDFGESSPIFDNSTWKGRLSNRRVDIVLRKIIL
jgi:OOP family OmpA-OmpF porin